MVCFRSAGGRLTNVTARLDEALILANRGDYSAAVSAYHKILADAPNNIEAMLRLGILAQRAGKSDLALSLFDRALTEKPDFVAARYNQAVLLHAMRQDEAALRAARLATDSDPRCAEAWDIQGQVLKNLGRYDEAQECHLRALMLHPQNAHFMGNFAAMLFAKNDLTAACQAAIRAADMDTTYPPMMLGNILIAMGYPDLAYERFRQTFALRPDYPDAAASAAMAALQIGDWQEGWRLWEQRPDLVDDLAPISIWQGQRVDHLLVYEDQGIGDALMFARFLPGLQGRAKRITLRVAESLRDLLADQFSFVDLIDQDTLVTADARCRLSSLPHHLQTSIDTIPATPYLAADLQRRAIFRERLKPVRKPRIGLVWAGNKLFHNDYNRSIPITFVKTLVEKFADHFVLMQKERDGEMKMEKACHDFSGSLDNFAATAALIAELDLVISVDTAVAHLAGALGKPVWVLLPFANDWRWLVAREDSPWYKSARLLRQMKPGDWTSVMTKLDALLATFITNDQSVLSAPPSPTELLRRNPHALPLPP